MKTERKSKTSTREKPGDSRGLLLLGGTGWHGERHIVDRARREGKT